MCDNLEQLLRGCPNEKLLKETIGGAICNETKSLEKEFPYTSEREEPFFAIPLDIKNKKNIMEALDLFIKPDVLEGDNKYHCEKYNRKVNAHRRSYLKRLSNTVVINLKRFEFDFNSMQRLKVNDYCEFPMNINLKPWTKEGIREREKNEQRPVVNGTLGNLGKVQDDFDEQEENKGGGTDMDIVDDLGEISEQSESENNDVDEAGSFGSDTVQ